jgi:ATP/maltotriose-dependent transcriptional regulator MalT
MNFLPELALSKLQLAELLLRHYPDDGDKALEHFDFAVRKLEEMKMRPSLKNALDLIDDLAEEINRRGERSTLIKLLQTIPEDELRKYPGLYATMLLDNLNSENVRSQITHKELQSSPSALGPLSQRELEVLRLIAQGYSNQQIADRLMISLNTTKTHVSHIFRKLDTTDRLQTVKRASELRLL